jgi:hypothetical protein
MGVGVGHGRKTVSVPRARRPITGVVGATLHALTTAAAVVEARSLPAFLRAPERLDDACVVAVSDGRPVTLLVRDAYGWRIVRTPLVARVDEPPDAVARRALARPQAERADPICCTDDHGRLLGVLMVDDVARRD